MSSAVNAPDADSAAAIATCILAAAAGLYFVRPYAPDRLSARIARP
jgi:hypothetical protein